MKIIHGIQIQVGTYCLCFQHAHACQSKSHAQITHLLLYSFPEGYLYSWCCCNCWDKADKIHYHHILAVISYLSIWCEYPLLKSSFHLFLLVPHSWLSKSCCLLDSGLSSKMLIEFHSCIIKGKNWLLSGRNITYLAYATGV